MDSRTLTDTSKSQLKNYLIQINQINGGDDGLMGEKVSALEVYKWFVSKEKCLYNALNNMR